MVENLAKALHTHGAWVTEYLEDSRRLRALAFWMGGEWVEDYENAIDGTPCEAVVTRARLVHYPDKVFEVFPDDEDIKAAGAVSYLGVPLLGLDGKVLGHLAVLDRRPMPESPRSLALFHIFAAGLLLNCSGSVPKAKSVPERRSWGACSIVPWTRFWSWIAT